VESSRERTMANGARSRSEPRYCAFSGLITGRRLLAAHRFGKSRVSKREIGAPAVMPWITGQGRALHCGRVHGWPSGRDRSGAIP
jgi:hypothetical protein